ncbi:MAG: FtsB family cell division protein [Mobilitalea sp.]
MKRNYKKRTGIGVIAMVVLILFGIISYQRIGLGEESSKADLKIKRLSAQIEEQEERAIDINNQKAYVQTKRYIEDIAREKLGLVYEDDIIFKAEE